MEVSSYRPVIYGPLCIYCKGSCLLECDIVVFGNHKLVFRRDVLFPFAGKNTEDFSKKLVVTYQTLHDITSEAAGITFVIINIIIIIIISIIYEFFTFTERHWTART